MPLQIRASCMKRIIGSDSLAQGWTTVAGCLLGQQMLLGACRRAHAEQAAAVDIQVLRLLARQGTP